MRSRFASEALVLLILAVILAAAANALAGPERKLRWIGAYDEPAAPARSSARPSVPTAAASPVAAALAAPAGGGKVFAPHPETAWVEISGDDVAALHASGILFLDARRTSVYREGHIAGARSIAVWEADADDKVKALFAEGRDQSAPIVVYCSGGECEDSHMLGQKLYFVGFDNVLVYKDGFPDWEKRGLPITRGPEP